MQGDRSLYTAFSTGRTYDARGPPPYLCMRCKGMHLSFHPCPTGAQQPEPQQPAPQPGLPPQQPLPPPGDLPPLANPGGAGGGGGTAAELHSVATTVYDLWAADFAIEPRALALRRWAESTEFAWARELRGVDRAGLLYAERSRADALARHLVHLAATGKSSASLRGTMLAVRMAEKLQLLQPTVWPIHCAIAAGAIGAYNSEPGQQVWGTVGMLRTMATAVRSETNLAVLALAVFSVCHGLRVEEAASIHRADVSQPS